MAVPLSKKKICKKLTFLTFNLKIMKKKLILLLFMTSLYSFIGLLSQCIWLNVAFATDLNAQQVKSVKEVFISINYDNEKLNNVFTDIENKTNFKFVYDKNDSFLKNRFSFQNKNSTVEDLLLKISQHSNLIFRQVNTNISVQKTNQRIKVNEVEVIIQTRNITGKVTSFEDGEGLPGVNVIEKGTNNGTVTNVQGEYSLEVSEGATLVFSSVGYTQEEVVIGEKSVIDVALTADIQQLQELVVVGYGTQKKSLVTGAISKIDSEVIEQGRNLRVEQALQGKSAGVLIMNNSGQPGSNVTVRIRGVGTAGDPDPLFIVDGLPMEKEGIDFLNPSDIESIEILKDAASTSIYGTRGANGVVLITTKSGKKGQDFQVTYDGFYGVQSPWRQLDMLNSQQYVNIINEAAANAGQPPVFSQAMIDTLSANTNWQDQMFNTAAPKTSHTLTFTGGSENSSYSSSLSYFSQDGIVSEDNSKFERITYRLNVLRTFGDFDVGSNLTFANINRKGVNPNDLYSGSSLIQAINMPPIIPL